MNFGNWPSNAHESEDQKKRIASAASSALTPVDVNYQEKTATFSGHRGIYQTSLDSCTCADFRRRHLPCKHIYRLAHETEHIDLGQTVMYSTDDIINPDSEDQVDKAIRISLVINEQPKSSYAPMLIVLRSIKELGRPQSTITSAIQHLEALLQSESDTIDGLLLFGRLFVLTGEFSLFSRTDAMAWLEDHGAKVSGSLGSKTDYVVAGQGANEGKLKRAEAMGIPILSEHDIWEAMNR